MPKENFGNEFYNWTDLDLAVNIMIFGKNFRIVQCDDFTRKFYQTQGIILGEGEEMPMDEFEKQTILSKKKIYPWDFKEIKEYFEVKLGGGHPNGGLEKFIKNDRKVLSFNILWWDKNVCGAKNFYVLNYFLADDSVEIKEVHSVNNGKNSFPLLLRR